MVYNIEKDDDVQTLLTASVTLNLLKDGDTMNVIFKSRSFIRSMRDRLIFKSFRYGAKTVGEKVKMSILCLKQ